MVLAWVAADPEVLVLTCDLNGGNPVRPKITKSSSPSLLVNPSTSSLSDTVHTISSSSEKDDSSPVCRFGAFRTGVVILVVLVLRESLGCENRRPTSTKSRPEEESEEAESVGDVTISESEGLEIPVDVAIKFAAAGCRTRKNKIRLSCHVATDYRRDIVEVQEKEESIQEFAMRGESDLSDNTIARPTI
jgi:hypothetical protein